MRNNFNLIKSFFEKQEGYLDDDTFLFGQIITRKKDGNSHNFRVIKDFVLKGIHDFHKKENDIINLCKLFNSRAYVNVTPRSYRKVCLNMAQLAMEYIERGFENKAQSIFSTVCGRQKPKNNYWVVDIDDLNEEKKITELLPNVELRVPTVNGVHLITKGFDIRELKNKFPSLDIHKNNPTLLFAP